MDGLSFHVDMILGGAEEAMRLVYAYAQENAMKFIIKKNDPKRLHYVCANGRAHKSRSGGSRPDQHHSYTGCGAHFNFSKRYYL